MNLIEAEWYQIKTHERAGRIFEDEYDLAIAVIESVETRAQRSQHNTERFLFKSSPSFSIAVTRLHILGDV